MLFMQRRHIAIAAKLARQEGILRKVANVTLSKAQSNKMSLCCYPLKHIGKRSRLRDYDDAEPHHPNIRNCFGREGNSDNEKRRIGA